MPVNKSAFLRYRIIDGCLTNPNRRYPALQDIINKIESQLGVSISDSMFSKDIQQMKSIYNAPIRYDRNHNGYCYTQDGFSIKEFPLTHEEIEALDMSTALLHQLKGTRMFQHFENAINKVIEGYRLSDILGKSENQLIQVEEPVRSESSHWLEPILKAIVEKNCLEVGYQGFGKAEKLHNISAYLLKEYRNRWYMIGHSNLSDKILVMALDRINSINTSKSPYYSSDQFVPAQFFNYSFGITQLHEAAPEKVVLSFSPYQANYILSQPMHYSQQVLLTSDTEVQVQLEVYITAELKMAILSYGAEIKVLAPQSLKNDLKATIDAMKLNY